MVVEKVLVEVSGATSRRAMSGPLVPPVLKLHYKRGVLEIADENTQASAIVGALLYTHYNAPTIWHNLAPVCGSLLPGISYVVWPSDRHNMREVECKHPCARLLLKPFNRVTWPLETVLYVVDIERSKSGFTLPSLVNGCTIVDMPK